MAKIKVVLGGGGIGGGSLVEDGPVSGFSGGFRKQAWLVIYTL
jgi:hypothetical protein